MTTFLFWNLNRRPLSALVRNVVLQHDVDVLVLAEAELRMVELLEEINAVAQPQFALPFNLSDDLHILIRYPPKSLTSLQDNPGVAIRQITPPIGLDVLLVLVHLSSKRYLSEHDQAQLVGRVARHIEEREQQVGHQRTIVLGDLNMNPFEAGTIGSEGLHAVSSRRIAARGTRTVQGVDRPFFYNPMWNFFGDVTPSPPGTYYYNASAPTTLFWNIFDQVLIRPALLENGRKYTVTILTEISSTSLLSTSGRPNTTIGSDHLPLLFRIDLEQGVML